MMQIIAKMAHFHATASDLERTTEATATLPTARLPPNTVNTMPAPRRTANAIQNIAAAHIVTTSTSTMT